MTAEQLQILTAIVGLLKGLGTWPVISVLALIILAPWGIHTLVSFNQNKRFESVVKMYENNVTLVNDVIKLGQDMKEMNGGYRELITWTVATITEVRELAEKNQFCPVIRKQTNPRDIQQ